MTELPSKLFYRIGEVAGLVGVEPHVLRYWEREFRSIRPTKSAKGQRVYSRKDVENLLRVRDLLYRDGFTIAGAKKRMQRAASAEPEAPTADAEPAADTDAGSSAHLPAVVLAPITERRAPITEPPVSGEVPMQASVRAKLEALRSEVEEFLLELEADGVHAPARVRGA